MQVQMTTIFHDSMRTFRADFKEVTVDLVQLSDGPADFCFFVLTKFTNDENGETFQDEVIRDQKEAMIRTINLWNSVVMEISRAEEEAPRPIKDEFPF